MIEVDLGKNYEDFSPKEKEDLSKLIERIQSFSSRVQSVDIFVNQNDFYLQKIAISISPQEGGVADDKLSGLKGDWVIDILDIDRPIKQDGLPDLKNLIELIKQNFNIVINQ